LAPLITLTRANNGQRIAVRAGTQVLVNLSASPVGQDDPMSTDNPRVVSVVSSAPRADGESQSRLVALTAGDARVVMNPIEHCPTTGCTVGYARAIDWQADITVNP
jgi:hypothetical protein